MKLASIVVHWGGMVSHFPIFCLLGAVWTGVFVGKPESFLVPKNCVVLLIPIAWIFYRSVGESALKIGRKLGGGG